MSVSRRSPSERRAWRVGTIVSIALHLLILLIFGRWLAGLFVHPHEDKSSPVEVVTIAQWTPKPTPVPTPSPAPQPKVRAAPPPPVATVPPPAPVAPPSPRIATPKPNELSAPTKSHITIVHTVPIPAVPIPIKSTKPVLAKGTHVAPKAPGKPRLSSSQIASIQNDLAGAIAQDKAANDPLKVDHPEPVATMKDYGASYSGFDNIGDGKRGSGLCDPQTSWQDHGYNYYYLACEVRDEDGSQHREIVPWPVRFPPTDDPFNGTAHRNVPVAMPLPGWHKDANTVISEELRAYAKEHGVDL